jgi:hypothetical protein
LAREEAIIPLPSEDVTPPVTKIYLGLYVGGKPICPCTDIRFFVFDYGIQRYRILVESVA